MHLSARKTFRRGDEDWGDYVECIGFPKLAQIRTIDLGLNETVEGSGVLSGCTLAGIGSLLADLPEISEQSYYQLAVNLSEEPALDSQGGMTLLGYDISDETWTSSLLNCEKWTGPLAQFEQGLNEFGLLGHDDARRAQKLLPEVWGEDNPHAFVDLWQLWELNPLLRGTESVIVASSELPSAVAELGFAWNGEKAVSRRWRVGLQRWQMLSPQRKKTLMGRMSSERMAKALEQLETISGEDYQKVKGLAAIVRPLRSVLHKTPDDHGMTGWRDVYFPSDDGTPLEGWYIPAKGGESDKLVIFNHALPMCRAGFPGHLGEPWSNFDAVEIDFVIQMKHLTDAGYNVLAYDIRNHGNSGAANGGLSGIGRWEWRDCVGVKSYVDADAKLSKMAVGLYSQCMGGNSQYEAIYRRPELFENVRCMCSPMVVSMEAIYSAFSELQGISQYQELIDLELLKMGAFLAGEMTPHHFAAGVKMPVLMVQVLDDEWTRNPEDAQKTFDLLGSSEKELFWIENTTKRFKDGYNHFGRHPETVLGFFDRYMN